MNNRISCWLGLVLTIAVNATGESANTVTNIRNFDNTPARELAAAVERNDLQAIESICRASPSLINTQDPDFGSTLLYWAVGYERKEAAKKLLECGADPNIRTRWNSETPLFRAAGNSFIDTTNNGDPFMVKLLLQHGADPNVPFTGVMDNIQHGTEAGETPLMNAIRPGPPGWFEKVKALVEGGADINLRTASGRTAAIMALVRDDIDAAYYLIVERKAEVLAPYGRTTILPGTDPNEKFYPVNLLRYWVLDLSSPKYEKKMAIVDVFLKNGVDYRKTPVPKRVKDQIMKLHPNDWEHYLEVY